jgi:hypothetical protein
MVNGAVSRSHPSTFNTDFVQQIMGVVQSWNPGDDSTSET